MEIRRKLVPQSWSDGLSVLGLVLFLHLVYWFELFIVLPQHYIVTSHYFLHCLLSTFLMFNIMGNYVLMYLTNTSIQGQMLNSDIRPNWKLCGVCETLTPPRSWHCSICNTCILKRDHHCNFAACCVGHLNHRYFLLFLVHLCLGGAYSAYHNALFLYNCTPFSFYSLLKLVFPMAVFVFGEMTDVQIYRVICVLTILGAVTVSAISVYYLGSAAKGLVMHERANGIKDYSLDHWLDNLIQALGRRYYLVWISPFIHSQLPSNGIDWTPVKKCSNKSK